MKILTILILLLHNIIIVTNQNQSIPELSQELALKLRADGLEHLSAFIDGGSKCVRNTPANQEGYYYFCSDLDTYEEMYQYLEETFTFEEATKVIESTVVVINDKLSYRWVGWGSTNDWSRANGTIVNRDDKKITYNFKVPAYGDEFPADDIKIEYQYVSNQGWRINSPARSLR